MTSCHELGLQDLVGSVIQRVLDVTKLPADKVYKIADEMLLPFVSFLLHDPDPIFSAQSIPHFQELQLIATNLYLDYLAQDEDLVSGRRIADLVEATVPANDASLFMLT